MIILTMSMLSSYLVSTSFQRFIHYFVANFVQVISFLRKLFFTVKCVPLPFFSSMTFSCLVIFSMLHMFYSDCLTSGLITFSSHLQVTMVMGQQNFM